MGKGMTRRLLGLSCAWRLNSCSLLVFVQLVCWHPTEPLVQNTLGVPDISAWLLLIRLPTAADPSAALHTQLSGLSDIILVCSSACPCPVCCCSWSADPHQRPCFNQVVQCLELMLESFTSLTQELLPVEQADAQMNGTLAAAYAAAAAAAAAAGGGGGGGVTTPAQQQQQQGGGGGPAASSERRRGLADSKHVQDL
jgi:hypothetical protein